MFKILKAGGAKLKNTNIRLFKTNPLKNQNRFIHFDDRPIPLKRDLKDLLYSFYFCASLIYFIIPAGLIYCAYNAPFHPTYTRRFGDAIPIGAEKNRIIIHNCSRFDFHCKKHYRMRKWRMDWEKKHGLYQD